MTVVEFTRLTRSQLDTIRVSSHLLCRNCEPIAQQLRDISITNSVPCLFTSTDHTSVLQEKQHTLIKKIIFRMAVFKFQFTTIRPVVINDLPLLSIFIFPWSSHCFFVKCYALFCGAHFVGQLLRYRTTFTYFQVLL